MFVHRNARIGTFSVPTARRWAFLLVCSVIIALMIAALVTGIAYAAEPPYSLTDTVTVSVIHPASIDSTLTVQPDASGAEFGAAMLTAAALLTFCGGFLAARAVFA